MSDYEAFLTSKRLVVPAAGIEIAESELHPALFPFQRALTAWALRKGRAALFASTGMGKTLMSLAWAQHVAERVLILAPLAVARQTVREGEKWGIPVTYTRSEGQAAPVGITITNYEMLGHMDVSRYGAVVLDESSILRDFEGKTRTALIQTFQRTPYRLCCTATPAPNDITEIANHAEFLGIMTRTEMLAAFFVHDQDGWRLKGHARKPFYRWLASWGISLTKPSDLGFDNTGYELPPLEIEPVFVPTDYAPDGQLFSYGLKGIGERASVRKGTVEHRVEAAVELVAREPDEPWLLWCGLNEEGRQLAKRIPDAVLVEGNQSPEQKADALFGFANGEVQILASKASISGRGMNLQNCARMAFVGLSDSWEDYFQCLRRCWRYGQERPVHAYIVLTEPEEPIYRNVLRKEAEADIMRSELIEQVRLYEEEELRAIGSGKAEYETADAEGENWRLLLGDSAERLRELPDSSIDLSVFSPPFDNLFTYSATERDLGNSRTPAEFWEHFGFIQRELFRVTKPGRNICCHVAQITSQKAKDGVIGMKDFRGQTIEAFQAAGLIYHGEVVIDKDPQAQAIRTKSKSLLFVQLRKDASWMRPALADYILIFRKPGENTVPIHPDISNEDWIHWARPVWYGIRESDTLNVAEARSEDDSRHICPLQLETIRRCIRLWSNPGETVLTPFAGIGSELVVALELGRRAVGCELKPEYWRVGVKNCRTTERRQQQGTLFSLLDEEEEPECVSP